MMQGGRRQKRHDYHKKQYSNPLFQKKKKSSIDVSKIFSLINIKSSFGYILIAGASGTLIWFVFASSTFKLATLNFQIPDKYNQAEISNLIWQEADQKVFFLSKRNLLLFNSENLATKINERYTVANLKVVKKFPRTLNVSFEDKVYRLLWQEQGRNYFVSPEDGMAKEVDLNLIKADGLPIINNSGIAQIEQNMVKNKDVATYIFNIYANISKNSKHKVENFRVGDDIGLIEVKFINGPIAKFTTTEGLDKQLEKLYNIINIKLRDDFLKKSYVDVRYGDTVYIK
jgi:cell division septal protein FtsQ